MTSKARRAGLLDAVQKQVEDRIAGPLGDLKSAQECLSYLNWLAWHCHKFAAVPSFLGAARSDIVAILYAGAIGLERSAYLHARSLLENLARHCYFDSRPALFITRSLEPEDAVHDKWAEQFKEIQRLPCFRPTWNTMDGTPGSGEDAILGNSALFAEFKTLYRQSSRFVHGSTVRYRSAYEGVSEIRLDPKQTESLGDFLQSLGEAGLLLLAMTHIGPYLLISQPIRRYMLLRMRPKARARFLHSMRQVSLSWANHQRDVALDLLRKRRPVLNRDGLVLNDDGSVLVVSPAR